MPYGLPKAVGGDSPANIKWMEDCIAAMKQKGNKDQGTCIAICKSTLMKHKGNTKTASIELAFPLEIFEQFKRKG